MTGIDILILGLATGFAGLYLSYRLIRALARWVLGTAAARSLAEQGREAVQMQRKGSGKSLRLKLASVFAWQVSINEEKGTAGGSIKLNFPIRSSLLVGLLCLGLAFFIGPISQFVVPIIFLLFAVHHLGRWLRSLGLLSRAGAAEGKGEEPGKAAEPERPMVPVEATPSLVARPPAKGLVWRSFRRGTRVWLRNILFLVPGFLFIELCAVLSLGITCGPFWGSLHRHLHASLEGRGGAGLFEGFKGGRFNTLVSLFFTEVLLVGLGGALGFIPGVLVAWLWMYSFSFAALEGQGYRQSIRSSVAVVLQNPLPNLGLAVLVHGLGFLPLVFGPGALLANAVVAPLIVAIVAAAFIEVRVPIHDRPEVLRLPVPALATT